MKHGDIARVQHMQAYQVDTTIGRSFGNVSDAHDLVVVPVSLSSGEVAPSQKSPLGGEAKK